MTKKNRIIWLSVVVLAILLIDQALKIWIKTNLMLGESIFVTDWFQLLFVENKGMAFGIELIDKLFLSLFRIVACGLLVYFIVKLIKENYRFPFILCIALIFAGAVGNLIDSVFYGQWFTHSYGQVATMFPAEGYASYFHGKVVDMFYFPLITDAAGKVLFFSPVFNFADSAVTVGVALVLLFFRKELNSSLETKKEKAKRQQNEA